MTQAATITLGKLHLSVPREEGAQDFARAVARHLQELAPQAGVTGRYDRVGITVAPETAGNPREVARAIVTALVHQASGEGAP